MTIIFYLFQVVSIHQADRFDQRPRHQRLSKGKAVRETVQHEAGGLLSGQAAQAWALEVEDFVEVKQLNAYSGGFLTNC